MAAQSPHFLDSARQLLPQPGIFLPSLSEPRLIPTQLTKLSSVSAFFKGLVCTFLALYAYPPYSKFILYLFAFIIDLILWLSHEPVRCMRAGPCLFASPNLSSEPEAANS